MVINNEKNGEYTNESDNLQEIPNDKRIYERKKGLKEQEKEGTNQGIKEYKTGREREG